MNFNITTFLLEGKIDEYLFRGNTLTDEYIEKNLDLYCANEADDCFLYTCIDSKVHLEISLISKTIYSINIDIFGKNELNHFFLESQAGRIPINDLQRVFEHLEGENINYDIDHSFKGSKGAVIAIENGARLLIVFEGSFVGLQRIYAEKYNS